jgi:hypothetical protein
VPQHLQKSILSLLLLLIIDEYHLSTIHEFYRTITFKVTPPSTYVTDNYRLDILQLSHTTDKPEVEWGWNISTFIDWKKEADDSIRRQAFYSALTEFSTAIELLGLIKTYLRKSTTAPVV